VQPWRGPRNADPAVAHRKRDHRAFGRRDRLAAGRVWMRGLLALGQNVLPRAPEIHIDVRVLAFAFLLSLATVSCSALFRSARIARQPTDSLKEGDRGTGRRGMRLRSALVVAEVAIGVVLMAVAGLLIRTMMDWNR